MEVIREAEAMHKHDREKPKKEKRKIKRAKKGQTCMSRLPKETAEEQACFQCQGRAPCIMQHVTDEEWTKYLDDPEFPRCSRKKLAQKYGADVKMFGGYRRLSIMELDALLGRETHPHLKIYEGGKNPFKNFLNKEGVMPLKQDDHHLPDKEGEMDHGDKGRMNQNIADFWERRRDALPVLREYVLESDYFLEFDVPGSTHADIKFTIDETHRTWQFEWIRPDPLRDKNAIIQKSEPCFDPIVRKGKFLPAIDLHSVRLLKPVDGVCKVVFKILYTTPKVVEFLDQMGQQ